MESVIAVIWAVLLSISPVSELRGGIPFAILNGISPVTAFFICVAANTAVIFFVLFFLDFMHVHLIKIRFYKRAFNFLIKGVRKKADKIEAKMPDYGYLALTIFVAVPLPVTGAWTASLIVWLLELDKKKSILAISLGVLIVGIAVLFATLGATKVF